MRLVAIFMDEDGEDQLIDKVFATRKEAEQEAQDIEANYNCVRYIILDH